MRLNTGGQQKPEDESKVNMVDGTLCRWLITSTLLDHKIHNPYTIGNPMPESTITLCQSRTLAPPPARTSDLASGPRSKELRLLYICIKNPASERGFVQSYCATNSTWREVEPRFCPRHLPSSNIDKIGSDLGSSLSPHYMYIWASQRLHLGGFRYCKVRQP